MTLERLSTRIKATGVLLALTMVVVMACISPSVAGAEWAPPVTLEDGGQMIQPDIAATRDGEVVAVWRAASPTFASDLKAAVAPLGGKLAAAQTLSDHASQHTVVSDGLGGAVAIWVERRQDRSEVRTSYAPPGGRFGDSELVGFGYGALKATANSRGDVAILFGTVTTPEELMVAVRQADGRISVPERVGSGSVEDRHHRPMADIALSASGEVIMAWNDSAWAVVAAHRPPGGTFSSPQALSRPGAQARYPQLAADATGGSVAAWIEAPGYGKPAELLAAFRRSGADFAEARLVEGSTDQYAVPHVGASDAGDAMIAFERYRSNPNGGYWQDQQVIMASVPEQMLTESRWVSPGNQPVAAMGRGGHAVLAEYSSVYGRSGGNGYELRATTRAPCADFGEFETAYAPPQSFLQVEMREADVDPQGNLAIFWHDRGEGARPASSYLSVSRSRGPASCGPPSAEAPPSVDGVAREDRLMRATDGTWRGGRIYGFRHQWRRCDTGGGACVDIAGATRSTYRLTAAEVGQRVRVDVRATTGGGSSTAQSDASATVGSPQPLPVAPALVSVTPSDVNGHKLRLAAGRGAANDVRVRQVGGEQLGNDRGIAPKYLLVTDNGSVLTAGPGCEAVPDDPQQVKCESWRIYELIVDLGDGDDTIENLAPLRSDITGGEGDDTLIGDKAQAAADFAAQVGEDSGAGGDSWIDGGPGADTIVGGADRDRLFGGSGNDSISAGAGYDLLCGGPPSTGSPHQDPCDLNVVATGNDFLHGGSGEDRLMGLDGDDRLIGARGPDQLHAGSGDDFLDGTAEPGEPAPADIGLGPPTGIGFGRPQDLLDGGDGNDRLLSRDGFYDQAYCGEGTGDSIERDSVDGQSSFDCEQSDPPLAYPPGVALPLSARLTRAGVMELRMGCDKRWTSDCAGQLKLAVSSKRPSRRTARSRKPAPVPLAQARFTVRPGESTRLKVKLTRRNHALVRRLRPSRLLLTALTPSRVVAPRVSAPVRVSQPPRKRR